MIPENKLSEEVKNEFNKIKEIEKTVNRFIERMNIHIILKTFEQ